MTEIYFAGTTGGNYKKLLKFGARNLLFSYYMLRKKKDDKVVDIFEDVKSVEGTKIFVDSGTHSFTTEYGVGVYKKRAKNVGKFVNEKNFNSKILKYMKDYIVWLKKFKKYLDVYVSLDVDEIIGPKQVDKYNQIFFDCGLKPLVVWHPERSIEDFEKMCQENSYVGIGGAKVEYIKFEYKIYRKLFDIAEKYKTKIHGFALTRTYLLELLPFFSADSTSWQSGFKYGQLHRFNGHTMKTFNAKSRDYNTLFKYQVMSWFRYSQYLSEYWKNAYWEVKENGV